MGDINAAVQWMLEIAADDTHGYDQANRNGPDYDCSSFVGTALSKAGFNVNPSVTTASMYSALTNVGFTVVDMDAPRQLGDIFLVYNDAHHHVVTCIDADNIVHASINELGTVTGGQTGDQTGKEICVRDFYTPSGGWSYHFRAPASSGTTSSWISGNRYLSESEMQNNAKLVCDKCKSYGWTLEAIAGTLGNFEREATINPGIWQNLDSGNTNLGYGLAQWTPADKILDWLDGKGYSRTNGDYQIEFIQTETDSRHYWVDRGYPLTFTEFQKSTQSPEYLALAFCYNYENAGVTADEERKANARKWYNYLESYYGTGGESPTPPTPDQPDIPTPVENSVYELLINTAYNMKKLSSAQIDFYQSIIVSDRVQVKSTFNRNKREFGYNNYGARITVIPNKRLYVYGVRKDGKLILRQSASALPIYLDPVYVERDSTWERPLDAS